MTAGQYIAVLSELEESDLTAVLWRASGFELRDALLTFRPGLVVGFVLLFRERFQEGTAADQVAATGRGAINIHGSRIPYVDEEDFALTRVNFKETHRVGGWTSASKGGQRGHRIEGRWPPNVLLIHASGCRRAGMTWECQAGCTALRLERESPGVTRLYPQFTSTTEMVAWILKLITPAILVRSV